MLTDPRLPESPETPLAEHALVLHLALRDVASRLGVDVSVDEEGRLHVAKVPPPHRSRWTGACPRRR
ncbi:hypothetical protein ABZU75_43165 [Streptosporangium sp. NPDC005286]|uniref:hypothetical protein n=1 Tax=Streptosporangium sp. NPDC005286 TaxID=3154463 RepID=UPI0033BA3F78